MTCSSCTKEITPDRMFCTWCASYIPDPAIGGVASLGRRFAATALDPFAFIMAYMAVPAILIAILGETLGGLAAFASIVALIVINFRLFVRGQTLGKWLMNEQVVDRRTGANPGFMKMIVREVLGKFVSALFFGLGFFWAIWDKDHQTFHDKIANTVVIKRAAPGRAHVGTPKATVGWPITE